MRLGSGYSHKTLKQLRSPLTVLQTVYLTSELKCHLGVKSDPIRVLIKFSS